MLTWLACRLRNFRWGRRPPAVDLPLNVPGPACDIISVDSALIYHGMDTRHRQT